MVLLKQFDSGVDVVLLQLKHQHESSLAAISGVGAFATETDGNWIVYSPGRIVHAAFGSAVGYCKGIERQVVYLMLRCIDPAKYLLYGSCGNELQVLNYSQQVITPMKNAAGE